MNFRHKLTLKLTSNKAHSIVGSTHKFFFSMVEVSESYTTRGQVKPTTTSIGK